MNNEANLLDVLVKVVKNRWLILKTVVAITLISLIISLIWPKTFKSTVRFFPPPRKGGGISGLFSNFFQPTVTTPEINPEAILVILRSRSLEEEVIQKFHLDEVYGVDVPELVLEELEANIEINEIREGGFGFNPLVAIEFSFLDRDPHRAEQVTQFYINKMDSILKSLNKERAVHAFKIIESRYYQNLKDLEKAENDLKNFQEKNGVFEIESQTKAIIQQLAELKAQLVQLEIELELLKGIASRESSRIINLRKQKAAIEKKFNDLVQTTENPKQDNVFQPLVKVPELTKQFTRLYRDVTVQNKVYEFIYPQYEQTRLQATMQTQGIQVLDPAKLPTYKYKPKRLFIVLAGFVFAIFLSLGIVFMKEAFESEKQKNSANYKKIVFILDTMKKDFKFLK